MNQDSEANAAAGQPFPDLVAADRLMGSLVHDSRGVRVGVIQGLVIHRVDGSVVYVILSLSEVLGLGSRRFPVPWDRLRFDPHSRAYVAAITETALRLAPHIHGGARANWDDHAWLERIASHYAADHPDGGEAARAVPRDGPRGGA